MYTVDALRRKIEKEGLDKVIKDLSSGRFSEEEKADLKSAGIFIDNYPNLSLLYFLASITNYAEIPA